MEPHLVEIGACEAVIFKISTLTDGGIRLVLDLNPSDRDLIAKLMDMKMRGDQLVSVGFAAESN